MKQVFNVKGSASVREVTEPICGEGEVLVQNMYSVISVGTELKSLTPGSSSMLKMAMKRKDLVQLAIRKAKKDGIFNTYNFAKAMMDNWWPLGYSCTGKVVEVGRNITDLSPGDIVACCGQDVANHAEYVVVPKNLVAKVPEGTDLKQASFSTIGSIVIHALHRADISFGQNVVIYGMGLLGQIAAKILNAVGCKVIGIDIDKNKVDKPYVHHGITSNKPVDDVMDNTIGIGADVVIVTAKADSSELVNNAMEMCRKKGKVVIVGHVNLDLQRKHFYEKELDVLISRAYGPGRHDPQYEKKGLDYPIDYVRFTINRNMQTFLDLIHDKKIDLTDMIEKEVEIKNAETAYQQLQSEGKKPFTIMIKYPEQEYKPAPLKKIEVKAPVKKQEKKAVYNVAVVGGGSFAREIHFPLLAKNPRFKLKTIMTKSGATASQLVSKFGAEKTVSEYNEILSDPDIDLVLIVTPHSEHADYAIKAIEAGKNVFLEKPMALNWEQCVKIKEALEKNPVVFVVGYHKSYSDAARSIAGMLKNRKNPFVMNYRTQLKMNKNKEWLYDPEIGGGRILGELCHVYDFINWAAASDAEQLFATAIKSDNKNVLPDSNLVANVSYKDGSIASVSYSEQGDPSLPKERIEIFFDNNIIILEDGINLNVNGKKSTHTSDRGYNRHYENLLKVLDGEKADVVGIDRALATMQLTLETLNRIKGVYDF